jgi:hypothetical protein
MSYEGHVQAICTEGHYRVWDTYDEPDVCSCGAAFGMTNMVDDTNGEAYGEIQMKDLAKFLKKPADLCPCCKQATSEPLYNVPDANQQNQMRTFRPDGGEIEYLQEQP